MSSKDNKEILMQSYNNVNIPSDFNSTNLHIDIDGCPLVDDTQPVVNRFKRRPQQEWNYEKHKWSKAAELWCREFHVNGNKLNYLKHRVMTSNEFGISEISQPEMAIKLQCSLSTIERIEKFFKRQGVLSFKKNGWRKTNECTILVIQHLVNHKPVIMTGNINNLSSCNFYNIKISDSNHVPDSDICTHVPLEPQDSAITPQLLQLGVKPKDTNSLEWHIKTQQIPNEVVLETIKRVRYAKVVGINKKQIGNVGGYFRTTLNQRFEHFKIIEREYNPHNPKTKNQLSRTQAKKPPPEKLNTQMPKDLMPEPPKQSCDIELSVEQLKGFMAQVFKKLN